MKLKPMVVAQHVTELSQSKENTSQHAVGFITHGYFRFQTVSAIVVLLCASLWHLISVISTVEVCCCHIILKEYRVETAEAAMLCLGWAKRRRERARHLRQFGLLSALQAASDAHTFFVSILGVCDLAKNSDKSIILKYTMLTMHRNNFTSVKLYLLLTTGANC